MPGVWNLEEGEGGCEEKGFQNFGRKSETVDHESFMC